MSSTRTEILFIGNNVTDYQTLLASIQLGVQLTATQMVDVDYNDLGVNGLESTAKSGVIGAIGTSSVEIEPNNSVAEANAIALSTTMIGQITTSSDLDYYKVAVTGQGTLNLAIDVPTDSSLDYFRLGLYNSIGSLLSAFTTGKDQTFQTPVAAAGYYYVSVEPSTYYGYDSSAAKQYKLTIGNTLGTTSGYESEPNNSVVTADTLALSTPVIGQITTSSDLDYYKVAITGQGTLNLTIDVPTDSSLDYFRLGLYNSTGSLLSAFTTGKDQTFQTPVAAAGYYYVSVEPSTYYGYDSSTVNQYSLTIGNTLGTASGYESEPNNSVVTADTLALSTPVIGQITTSSDLDYYKVAVTSAGTLNLAIDVPTDSSLDYFRLGLYNSTGSLLSAFTTGKDQTFQTPVAAAGYYYVSVEPSTYYGYDSSAVNQYSLTIGNTPKLSITLAPTAISTSEGDTGNQSLNFTATLSAATTSTVTVDYATANGTATAGSDYTSSSGTLIFVAGQTSKTISVPILDDTNVESDETFTLTLSNPSGATLGSAASSTATIVDNDKPTITLSPTTTSITEGDSGSQSLNFTASLSAAFSSIVTVNYATANGTATASSDYTSTSGTLTFFVGETSKAITIPILGDTSVESDETFTLTLSSPSGATLGSASSATATIIENDKVVPVVTLAPTTTSVTEGDTASQSLNFTVSLSAAATSAVTVNYATANGTATAGSDYTSTSGTLSFAAGETSKTISVSVLGDKAVESSETFTLALSNLSGATLGSVAGATVTIIDNDSTTVLPSFTVPGTLGNDFFIPSGGNTYLGGGGSDTYIISPYTLSGTVTAKITDTEGANVIQLVDGLTIASSSFYGNAVQLTLSNGASVQILGAAAFGYQVGANAPAGDTASSQTYAQFAATLGASVPTSSTPVSGTANFVVPTSASAALAMAGEGDSGFGVGIGVAMIGVGDTWEPVLFTQ